MAECMFFKNLRVAPAFRPVEFGDDRFGVFYADLVDAVLVAVQRQQAGIARIAARLDRRDHPVRVESFIGVCVHCGSLASMSSPVLLIWAKSSSPSESCSLSADLRVILASRNCDPSARRTSACAPGVSCISLTLTGRIFRILL